METIFYKLDEILEGHLVFQIALHDKMREWDEHESVGGQFLENVGLHLGVLNCFIFLNHRFAC